MFLWKNTELGRPGAEDELTTGCCGRTGRLCSDREKQPPQRGGSHRCLSGPWTEPDRATIRRQGRTSRRDIRDNIGRCCDRCPWSPWPTINNSARHHAEVLPRLPNRKPEEMHAISGHCAIGSTDGRALMCSTSTRCVHLRSQVRDARTRKNMQL